DDCIETPKELPSTVAASCAEDCANLRVAEHFQKFAEPALPCSREVAKRRRNVRADVGLETKAFKFPATLFQEFFLDVAGGGDDTHVVGLVLNFWVCLHYFYFLP